MRTLMRTHTHREAHARVERRDFERLADRLGAHTTGRLSPLTPDSSVRLSRLFVVLLCCELATPVCARLAKALLLSMF